jgi:TRAP-type mannitol/chloroaromatic compound transport system permease small subunit
MSEPSPALLATIRTVDRFTDWTGTVISWLSVPLVAAVAYEVIARYVFNAPTIWSFDVTYMLYGTLFMLAGAYTLSRNGHVRADVVYRLWKPRTQASMDLVLYILFFLPAIAALMYSGWNYAAMSVRFKEVSIFSPAGVPVFPLKALIPITGFLLFLQGLAEVIRCVLCIRTGQWPQRLHDVEETESVVIREHQAAEKEKGAGA